MLPTDKQARKERPIARGVLDYFPDAIAAVANVSYVGNQQHNPGEEMHWARGKSMDHADCIARHLIERNQIDEDGLRHSAKAAWRALALLQLELETADGQNGQNGTPHVVGGCPQCAVPQDSAWQPDDYKDIRTFVRDDKFIVQERMFNLLFQLGCKADVAQQIVSGTTIGKTIPGSAHQFVYIAGPMRGIDKFNFPAFDAARDLFVGRNWRVISPADIDRHADVNENTPADQVQDQRVFAYRDLMALQMIAQTEGGAIAMLPGWHKSTGAVGEFFVARWLKLPILDARTGMSVQPPSPLEQSELFHTVTKFLTGQI